MTPGPEINLLICHGVSASASTCWRVPIAEAAYVVIATRHDPAVIRKILAHLALSHSGPSPGPGPPESGAARLDRIGSRTRQTPSPVRITGPQSSESNYRIIKANVI